MAPHAETLRTPVDRLPAEPRRHHALDGQTPGVPRARPAVLEPRTSPRSLSAGGRLQRITGSRC
jgi:hypothetical protein